MSETQKMVVLVNVIAAATGAHFSVESAATVGFAVAKALLDWTGKSSAPAGRVAWNKGVNGKPWSASQRTKFQRTVAMRKKASVSE